MKTVFKQVIHPNSTRHGVFQIDIVARKGSRPLSVGKQCKDVCVWFSTDTHQDEKLCPLYCVGTGFGRIPEGAVFVGTLVDVEYVWHFFYNPLEWD